MARFLFVCLGGAVGSGARFALCEWLERATSVAWYGTLAVNVLGSFLLGAVLHLAASTEALSPVARDAVAIGVLGGFTTYSTFNQQVLSSVRAGAWSQAALYAGGTFVLCLGAGALGLVAARAFAAR